MLGCLVFWRFGDLLIVWLFDCLVGLLCFVLFCLVLFVSSLQLDRRPGEKHDRKVFVERNPLELNSRKRVRHSRNPPRPNAVV